MSKRYSELIEVLLKLQLIPMTGYGSIEIEIKDYKINGINKTTHYLCKDNVVSKEIGNERDRQT